MGNKITEEQRREQEEAARRAEEARRTEVYQTDRKEECYGNQ